jgi:hypothetical protein
MTKIQKILLIIILLLLILSVPAMAYKFSITNVENYEELEDLSPWGTLVANNVKYWLGTQAGWTKVFEKKDTFVLQYHFDVTGTPLYYTNLDKVDFHYHFGHGSYITDHTEIDLTHSPNPTSIVKASQVNKRWDILNKWVFLDACRILSDPQWGSALKYSHGILGFSTTKLTSVDCPDRFFSYSINSDYPISTAFQRATQESFDSSVTAVIFADTLDQAQNDHLPGQGYVSPNENPDDGYFYSTDWVC